jgi:hypothetical protein
MSTAKLAVFDQPQSLAEGRAVGSRETAGGAERVKVQISKANILSCLALFNLVRLPFKIRTIMPFINNNRQSVTFCADI